MTPIQPVPTHDLSCQTKSSSAKKSGPVTGEEGRMTEIILEAVDVRIALVSEESAMYNEGQRDLAEA